ncbi:Phosphoribosyl transferase domain [seawater metagenome]|uniref:ribose-phosphate diphosphokinase n=1 Tax=seawater metagenome TaxID=1561972 RepID=A0A5E8CIK8_9ZZZZ
MKNFFKSVTDFINRDVEKLLLLKNEDKYFVKNINLNMQREEIKIQQFKNFEYNIQIDKDKIRNKDCIILFIFNNNLNESINDKLIQLFQILDLCSESNVNSITLILPKIPYQRHDHSSKYTIPFRKNIIQHIHEKVDTLITSHIHNEEFINKNLVNVKYFDLFANNINNLELNSNNIVLVGPDNGSNKMVSEIADKIKSKYIIFKKIRKDTNIQLYSPSDNYDPQKTYIILDDIISSGKTIMKTIELLNSKGVTKIYVYVIHLDVNNVKKLFKKLKKKKIKKLIVTNSINLEEYNFYNFIDTIDIRELIIKAALTSLENKY